MSIQEQTPQVDEGAVITLTDTAVTKVRELIAAESEENLALRVAVRPGGCSFWEDAQAKKSAADGRRHHSRHDHFRRSSTARDRNARCHQAAPQAVGGRAHRPDQHRHLRPGHLVLDVGAAQHRGDVSRLPLI